MSAFEERNGELFADDGLRLHFRSWRIANPRAVLLIAHGLGEHCGRYAVLARDLGEHGVEVHALDHRGHGGSGGQRGHISRFSWFVADLERFRQVISDYQTPGLPTFLLGHSLGGLIAIRYLQAHPEAPLRGAILSAPALGVGVEAPRWKVMLSRILTHLLPWLPFRTGLPATDLSSAPGYAEDYLADPLVHARVTPRLYTEMMAAMQEAFAQRERIRVPMLLLAPQADRIVLPAAVSRWAQDHPGQLDVRSYEGFRHESLNEKDRDRAVKDVADWIHAHL